MDSFYKENELISLGLKEYGQNVRISRNCFIYGAENITIGNNVRIDDFCILSGNIKIGSNVHISAYTALYASYGIEIEDYVCISVRCTLFSASDDLSGQYLVGAQNDDKMRKVVGGKIILKKYSAIGAHSTIFPGVTIDEGCAIGSMSLVKKSLDRWSIYVGIPVKKIANRQKGLLKFLTDQY